MADTKISLTGRGAWRLLGASSLVLALAACSGLPTAPTQPVRYDLGMTRGGLFFFSTPETKFSFDLRYYPEDPAQQALYKWYYTQGGRGGL